MTEAVLAGPCASGPPTVVSALTITAPRMAGRSRPASLTRLCLIMGGPSHVCVGCGPSADEAPTALRHSLTSMSHLPYTQGNLLLSIRAAPTPLSTPRGATRCTYDSPGPRPLSQP